MSSRLRPVPGSPGLVGVLAAVVAGVAAAPPASAVQDTADTREQGWIGVSLGVAEVPPAAALRSSVRFRVAGVYPNSPADLADIAPGDWFVSLDGNPLATYETWLRFTSELQPGQPVVLVVGRNGDQTEVTVVADPAPAFVAPNPLDRMERTMARFDSIMDALLGYSAAAVPWPWHTPGIMFHEGFDVDSGTLTVTVGPQTATTGVVVRPRDDGSDVAVSLQRTGAAGAQPESPPSAGGGGTELTMGLDRLVDGRFSVLTPRLPDGPVVVVLGGMPVRDLPAELGRHFGVERGVLVMEVFPMSPGLQAGFLPGDVLVSVEDRAVESVAGLRRLLAELDTPIELTVVRRKESVKLVYPRPRE